MIELNCEPDAEQQREQGQCLISTPIIKIAYNARSYQLPPTSSDKNCWKIETRNSLTTLIAITPNKAMPRRTSRERNAVGSGDRPSFRAFTNEGRLATGSPFGQVSPSSVCGSSIACHTSPTGNCLCERRVIRIAGVGHDSLGMATPAPVTRRRRWPELIMSRSKLPIKEHSAIDGRDRVGSTSGQLDQQSVSLTRCCRRTPVRWDGCFPRHRTRMRDVIISVPTVGHLHYVPAANPPFSSFDDAASVMKVNRPFSFISRPALRKAVIA